MLNRKTKIVATIGPATSSKDQLEQLILAGMSVARLNFSHGAHEGHAEVIKHLRALSKELNTPVAILQDLQGPKIRVTGVPPQGLELTDGEEVMIGAEGSIYSGSEKIIYSDFKEIIHSCNINTTILIDDGKIELKVTEKIGEFLKCEVIHGGLVMPRKGINIPGAYLPVECLTKKDLEDLEFGLKLNVDYIALSFVRKADDIWSLRNLVNKVHPEIKIIAKIEMLEALEHLDAIIQESDGVMVARGDLATEVGQSQLPLLQKEIIDRANYFGKPVITATQMLESMVVEARPTRAEITDIANAVLDGSDALMLSAESASGKHPIGCVKTMHEIITEVEKGSHGYFHNLSLEDEFLTAAKSIAASASICALKLNASAIICLSTTGKTATHISSYRPRAKIIAVTDIDKTLNQLQLAWGIEAITIDDYIDSEDAMKQILAKLLANKVVDRGDKVVLTLGMPVRSGVKTNTLRVFEVTD